MIIDFNYYYICFQDSYLFLQNFPGWNTSKRGRQTGHIPLGGKRRKGDNRTSSNSKYGFHNIAVFPQNDKCELRLKGNGYGKG